MILQSRGESEHARVCMHIRADTERERTKGPGGSVVQFRNDALSCAFSRLSVPPVRESRAACVCVDKSGQESGVAYSIEREFSLQTAREIESNWYVPRLRLLYCKYCCCSCTRVSGIHRCVHISAVHMHSPCIRSPPSLLSKIIFWTIH